MINEVNVGTYSEEPRSRADSRCELAPGPTESSFHPWSSGFLCISPDPDPRVTLWVAWIATPFQNLYLHHHLPHWLESKRSVPFYHNIPHATNQTPEVICTALDQPEPWRSHAQRWINQLNSVWLWGVQWTSAPVLGEFSFPLVEHEVCWEVGKREAYVENIKPVTSTVRGKSRAR